MKYIVSIKEQRPDDEELIQGRMPINAIQSENDSISHINAPIASPNDRLPPINLNTLKELSIENLISNYQVRHDIALDPDCRVKNKGKLMSREFHETSAKYWHFVEMELGMLLDPQTRGFVQIESTRLFTTLGQIREMLLDIYPNSQIVVDCIKDSFDLDHIKMSLKNGSFNVVEWIEHWIEVIKANCAPRRDGYVDTMADLARENRFVDLLRVFLELNNMMKLDLVNYALAQKRSEFEKTLVQSEQQYFLKEFSSYRLFPNFTKRMLREAMDRCQNSALGEIYLHGFLRLIADDTFPLPETFYLDKFRINLFRTDLQNLSIIGSLYLLMKQLCRGIGREPEKWMRQIQVLICHQELKIQDLGNFILASVNRIRLENDQNGLIGDFVLNLVSKMTDPQHQVYRKIKEAVMELIRNGLSGGKPKDVLWYRSKGLELLIDECEKLFYKIKVLYVHNWNVFSKFYSELIHKL